MARGSIIALLLALKGDSIVKYGHERGAHKVKQMANDAHIPSEHDMRMQEASLARTEFNIMLLTYMMNSDDGAIDKQERQALQQHLEPILGFASRADLKAIGARMKDDVTFADIKAFVEQHGFNDIQVKRAMRILRQINGDTYRYSTALFQLEQEFKYHLDIDLTA
mgnify:CR=1 FL=1